MTCKYIEPRPSEKEYRELAKLGRELGIPVPECFLEIKVILKGQILHHYKQRSHSWTRNAYNGLFTQLTAKNYSGATFQGGVITMKYTNGTIYGPNYAGHIISGINNYAPGNSEGLGSSYRADTGSLVSGIVVGSGNAAEDFNGHVLATPIAEGSGAGQLNYSVHLSNVKSWDAGTKTWSVAIARYMNNNSGGNITIREVAQYTRGMIYSQFPTLMVARDVLSPEVVLPNSGQLKVTYTVSLTYPV